MLKLLIATVTLSLLSGCGKKDEKKEKKTDPTPVAEQANSSESNKTSTDQLRAVLQGNWKASTCSGATYDESTHRFDNAIREYFTFSENTVSQKYTRFEGIKCDSKKVSFMLSGDYIIGERAKTQDATQLLTIKMKKVLLVPEADKVADAMNSENVCGISDWKTGEPREVNSSLVNCPVSETESLKDVSTDLYVFRDTGSLQIYSDKERKSHKYTLIRE